MRKFTFNPPEVFWSSGQPQHCAVKDNDKSVITDSLHMAAFICKEKAEICWIAVWHKTRRSGSCSYSSSCLQSFSGCSYLLMWRPLISQLKVKTLESRHQSAVAEYQFCIFFLNIIIYDLHIFTFTSLCVYTKANKSRFLFASSYVHTEICEVFINRSAVYIIYTLQ